jgi:membrane protease YdiL (CAAX protease family)
MSTQPEDDTDEQDGEGAIDDQAARNLVVGLAITVEGGLIAAAWLLGWLLDVSALGRFEFEWEGAAWGLLAAVPMLVGFFAAVRYPVGPLRSIKRFTDETIRPLMTTCSIIDLLGISVLAGVGEELLFRGVLQETFGGWMGVWAGVALAAVLFGLLHAVTPSYAVLAAVMGVYLGLVFHFTDNLLAAVVAHAVYDFVALIWVTRGPGTEPQTTDSEEESEEAEES